MSASAPVPEDHPLMKAWEAYVATEDYANSFKWAGMPEHRKGSMWAAFLQGWFAAGGENPHAPKAVLGVLPECPSCAGQRMKGVLSGWARSRNYTADREVDPLKVTFANGRTVEVKDGHLIVGLESESVPVEGNAE